MAYGFNNSQQNQGFQQKNQNFQQQIPMNQMGIQNQNPQPLFPLPEGNVYNINSTLEVANVPIGAGISVALCLPENVMYIKTLQNGNPLFYPYRILPLTNENETSSTSTSIETDNQNEEILTQLKECLSRISALEETIKTKKKGVEFNI